MMKIEIDGINTHVWIDGHEIHCISKLDVHAEACEIPVVTLELISGGSINDREQ